MGTVLLGESHNHPSTMKMFVVLALVAAAVAEPEAEADAQYISTYGAYGAHAYSPYTHGLPLNTYSATPLVRSYPASATPLVRSSPASATPLVRSYPASATPLVRSYTPY